MDPMFPSGVSVGNGVSLGSGVSVGSGVLLGSAVWVGGGAVGVGMVGALPLQAAGSRSSTTSRQYHPGDLLFMVYSFGAWIGCRFSLTMYAVRSHFVLRSISEPGTACFRRTTSHLFMIEFSMTGTQNTRGMQTSSLCIHKGSAAGRRALFAVKKAG
jgi:hypothetical protein